MIVLPVNVVATCCRFWILLIRNMPASEIRSSPRPINRIIVFRQEKLLGHVYLVIPYRFVKFIFKSKLLRGFCYWFCRLPHLIMNNLR